jgi:alginate O-acetyltransferase complex protein AlgI
MVFSAPPFLFFFLPAVLAVYWTSKARWHNAVLLGSSLAFYAWGERAYVSVLLVSIVLNWACGIAAEAERGRTGTSRALTLGILGNLGLLCAFKYANFIADNLGALSTALGGSPVKLPQVHLPIGISFFAFQGMSYLIDVQRGTVTAQRSLLNLAMYKAFFPQLIAGPIVRYVDVKPQIVERSVSLADFDAGLRRFVIGLGKKMILANAVSRPADEILALPLDQLTGPLAWIAMVAYTLQIYLDFSAYSDMAIGLGRMFGFRFLENFDYPYAASSITAFWRRWHISLSSWFRDYLYIPLGGNRVGTARRYVNLLVVFLLCGLWHGASWNFAIWGLYHGLFLVLERLPFLGWLAPVPKIVRHAYVLLVVVVGWVFFRADSMQAASALLRAMTGLSHPTAIAPGIRLFLDSEVVASMFMGAMASAPLARLLTRWLDQTKLRRPTLAPPLELAQSVWLAGVLAYAVMLMAAGSYSPFIYFRF